MDTSIFRSYDIRGTVPDQFNEDVAYAVGQAFVAVTGAKRVAVGRDVRASGPDLQAALIRGVLDAGADVLQVGVISTEMLYFASGTLDCDGGMSLTASHNPKQWNGVKFIGKEGLALTKPGTLGDIYAWAQSGQKLTAEIKGTVTDVDLLSRYTDFLRATFLPELYQSLTVVANVNFGANGKVVDQVLHDSLVKLVRLNWEEDGTFPKGTPDPLLPQNRKEIEERIVAEKAAFGVAFDADADRAFFYDEQGRPFMGAHVIAMLAGEFLKRQPGATILHEPRVIWATLDAIKAGGGVPLACRTGHGFIKQAMREHQAAFGGENSGHFYYKDFWYCDNGMITFLKVLGIFARTLRDGGRISGLLDYYRAKYPASEELNFTTDKAAEIMAAAKEQYSQADLDELDGVSLAFPDWRFNLRMSNNEPVLRLNLETRGDQALLEQKQAELVSFIEGFGANLRND